MFDVGICLSGGGARGIFHIGVLQALEEFGVQPQIISGTSAGALIGVLYASGLNPNQIREIASSTKWFKFIKAELPNGGLMGMQYLEEILRSNIQIDDFANLKMPVRITACNISKGNLEVFLKGPVIQAVLASCSVPMLFKPVSMHEQLYLDGGILCNLPASLIRNECRKLIGVSLTPIVPIAVNNLNSGFKILTRVLELSVNNNTEQDRKICDLIIESPKISSIPKYQLNEVNTLYEMGYESAMVALKDWIENPS